jgi:hypothetical protein
MQHGRFGQPCRRRIGKLKLIQEPSMKRSFRSFVARPLLVASMLTSKASGISQSAYTYVYNSVMQSCGQTGGSNCGYYAELEASRVRDSVYASQYNQCIASGGPC